MHFSRRLHEKHPVAIRNCFKYLLKKCLVAIGWFSIYLIENHLTATRRFYCNPTLKKCEDDTHTPKMGTRESSTTLENSKFNCRGQNILLRGVFYTIGKVLKCKCRKWPWMSHSKICSICYGRKKGRESNYQFDSWPLKVGNRPDPRVCKESATHR
jgi:hypothetical protein